MRCSCAAIMLIRWLCCRGEYGPGLSDGARSIDDSDAGTGPGKLAGAPPIEDEDMGKEMQQALAADGEKLRQLTGQEHGPSCPRCLKNPAEPIFPGSPDEGPVCGDCRVKDRAQDWRP